MRGTTISRTPRLMKESAAVVLVLVQAACGGGGGGGTPDAAGPAPDVSQAAWRSLATARPVPLDGAVRIAVDEVELMSPNPWGLDSPISVPLGLSELVVAGLLRRPDVHFVERRRFAAAVDAVRTGVARPGAPPVGVSVGPEFLFSVTWASFGASTSYLEMRLIDAQSGSVAHSWRSETPSRADAVGLARHIVGSLLGRLGQLGRMPAWSDPLPGVAPSTFEATSVPAATLTSFLEGLAAEERWDWNGAYRGYLAAAADPTFFEAEVALARAARLRLGGTLGES